MRYAKDFVRLRRGSRVYNKSRFLLQSPTAPAPSRREPVIASLAEKLRLSAGERGPSSSFKLWRFCRAKFRLRRRRKAKRLKTISEGFRRGPRLAVEGESATRCKLHSPCVSAQKALLRQSQPVVNSTLPAKRPKSPLAESATC